MAPRFNPPPNWPVPPQGWTPPKGWMPHPAWGKPPHDWEIWVDEPRGKKKSSEKSAGTLSNSTFLIQLKNKLHEDEIPYGFSLEDQTKVSPTTVLAGASVLALGLAGLSGTPNMQRILLGGTDYELTQEILNERQANPYIPATEAHSRDLDQIKGNAPKVYEGTGDKEDLAIERPDGETSPAWIEFEFIPAPGTSYATEGISTTLAPSGEKNSTSISFSAPQPAEGKSVQPFKGSCWLAGDDPVPLTVSAHDDTKWKITLHSAADAPVYKPGDHVEGKNIQAFRYQASQTSTAQADTKTTREANRPSSVLSNFQLEWENAGDHDRAGVGRVLLAGGDPEFKGSVELLPGDYLMQTDDSQTGTSWSMDFTEETVKQINNPNPYQLNNSAPAGEVSGEGKQKNVSLQATNDKPGILAYHTTTGPRSNYFGISNDDFWAYGHGYLRDYSGVEIVNKTSGFTGLEVNSETPWSIKSYNHNAIPTYGPGDSVSFNGPAVFYWNADQETPATVHQSINGDYQNRSEFKVLRYIEGEDYDPLNAIYRSEAETINGIATMPATEKPILIQVDVSLGNSWSMHF